MSYPLLLAPQFDPKIWGGRRLETVLGKALPTPEPYGESLESDDRSTVTNGPLAGRTIADLIRLESEALLGSRGVADSDALSDFPLLAKFIDATDVLSVQVHPNDDEAAPIGKRGKTEAWHIIAADPGSKLITGVRPHVTVAEIEAAIYDIRLGELVIEQPVRAGDTLFVPAGTTHAIGAGILLYEIQQASDVTYRMYDWGRLDDRGNPRELHVAESLAVVKPELQAELVPPQPLDAQRQMLTACRYFALEKWTLPLESGQMSFDGATFRLISSIGGNATLRTADLSVELLPGQTVLLPAAVTDLEIAGDATLLVSYIPESG